MLQFQGKYIFMGALIASSAQGFSRAAFILQRMHGAGNRILVLDLRFELDAPQLEAAHIRSIVDDGGEAFDQLMVLYPPQNPATLAKITIFNQDGSLSGACGNGMRCVVAWLVAHDGLSKPAHMVLETDAGLRVCTYETDRAISVAMGEPEFAAAKIPLEPRFAAMVKDTSAIPWPCNPTLVPDDVPPPASTFSAVNMGNPHAVFLVEDIHGYDLARFGPRLETCALFPQRVNIALAKILTPHEVALKVWERGAGLTLACGSAACACVVALARQNRLSRTARVHLPGGALDICWQDDNTVLMTGPAVFEDEIILPDDFYKNVPQSHPGAAHGG